MRGAARARRLHPGRPGPDRPPHRTLGLTTFPTTFSSETGQTVSGRVSRWLRSSDLAVQYRRETSGRWTTVIIVPPGASGIADGTFEFTVHGLGVSAASLQVRVVALGTEYVARAASPARAAVSYDRVAVAELPVVSGAFTHGTPYWVYGARSYTSDAISPVGTVTFDLRGRCRSLASGVFTDARYRSGADAPVATVALDGTVVHAGSTSGEPADLDLDLTGRQQLTLSAGAPVDPLDRVWFGDLTNVPVNGADGGAAVCAL